VKCTKLGEVETMVSSMVNDYMTDNFKLVKNSPTLAGYVMEQELIQTKSLYSCPNSYCACRRAQLDRDMEDKFTRSWLGKHHLAVAEDVCVETMEVLD